MGRFESKAALISGAASGIGRATAIALASEGAAVFGIDINEAGLAETRDEVESQGGRMQGARIDVTELGECKRAVAEAIEAFGRLDVLANIAGASRFYHFEQMEETDWSFMIGLNLNSVAFMCQAGIPHLKESQGAIVNVASVAGLIGQAYTVAYCAAKGGVVQLTRALAAEYVKTGLRINAVAPGGVKTPLNKNIAFPDEMDWELAKPYMGHRGMCDASEIAAAIAYLASDEARFVHGTVLTIDGGVVAV